MDKDGDAGPGQRLRALDALFRARLPMRLEELETALAQCELSAFRDGGAVVVLHGLLHRMAGSAGTFGCHELGERAGACERMLAAHMEGAVCHTDAAHHLAADIRGFLQWAGCQAR